MDNLRNDAAKALDWQQNSPFLDSDGDRLIKAGLKLNHLRLIAAVAEHGQVSAAADAMNISQPAASRLLNEAEVILRAPLFERVAKGMEATRFGEAMAKRARAILLEIREADRKSTRLNSSHNSESRMPSSA
jgi:DNA-binding transcriptional LysR family regulator